jgi:hypothetical protein
MPPAGFEPTIPSGERPQPHALDRASTWIGLVEGLCVETVASDCIYISVKYLVIIRFNNEIFT